MSGPRAAVLTIAAALFLKNITFKFFTRRFDETFEFSAEDRAVLRQHMLSTIVHSPDLVRCAIARPQPTH